METTEETFWEDLKNSRIQPKSFKLQVHSKIFPKAWSHIWTAAKQTIYHFERLIKRRPLKLLSKQLLAVNCKRF